MATTILADAPARAAEMPDEAPTAAGPTASPAMAAMAALLDELVAAGLQHIVLCPGSRSQALALLAADLERSGRVRLHVRVDERSAGFLALGIGRQSGRPAAVIVTSGTAVGNLLPAAMEAHHAGVPLLLLTADRPHELRGVGANQATTQPGMFSAFVRFETDAPVPVEAAEMLDTAEIHGYRELARRAWRAATGAPAGAVHLNLPVREPLAGAFPEWWSKPASGEGSASDPAGGAESAAVDEGALGWDLPAHTLLVAGADAGPEAAVLAEERGWPLVAEIVSGARLGANVVPDYRAALRSPELADTIQRVAVIGHPTLTREVARLLSRADLDIVAVPATGERLNLNGRTRPVTVEQLRDAARGDRDSLERWLRGSAPAAPAEGGISRADLVRAVWRASGPADRVMFGSSRLVRVADSVLEPRAVRVHANRGLAGIDGTIATAIGIDAAAQSGVTRVILGDLTLLHDAGSLLLPADEPDPHVQLVVGNDGGGTIFDTLEVAGVAAPEAFRRVQYTPQQVDLAALARAYGWEHVRVRSVDHLAEALDPRHTRCLIEVPLDR
ncbi:2-succinyl-5-enolpyruvyl-6-hydroxy-3-cyclohexene-1-carboxylic-acid synthase [Microbacterium nymphoidis]|uniref:2-succinyl-5-enolpyruvyl-6-hydroxy-3- cyclohexene-1-carboxylic-acid synthase n=1 Tax=Microbacterium nymphoidis TaxID=2898586 RepID=UPI0027E17AEE|nr:2-succinyl-5-enolpyruvyl-6-hydroxy-3-cyclohexene-1-carboxylic-acid synthase [Microbacterium nymphoidis]